MGFHKQATHRRHDDELFFILGLIVHDWGWSKNGPFWTKKGQTWQACQHSKVVQKGPKGTKMVNLNVFDHLGPILGPSGPFWTVSNKRLAFRMAAPLRGRDVQPSGTREQPVLPAEVVAPPLLSMGAAISVGGGAQIDRLTVKMRNRCFPESYR